MSRTRFRVAGSLPTSGTGRDVSALGYAVDKFSTATPTSFIVETPEADLSARFTAAGAGNVSTFQDRDQSTGAGKTWYISGVVQCNAAASGARHTYIVDRDVLVDNGSLQVDADGCHVYFINCNIMFVGARQSAEVAIGTANVSDNAANTGGLTGTELNTRSINFWGCSIIDAQTVTGGTYPATPTLSNRTGGEIVLADFIQSDLTYTAWGDTEQTIANGGRLINSTIRAPSTYIRNPYILNRGPHIFEGMSLDNITIIPSSTNRAVSLYRPRWTNTGDSALITDSADGRRGQLEYFSFDPATGTATNSPLVVVDGISFGPSPTTGTVITSGGTRRPVGAANPATLSRRFYNYRSVAPRFVLDAGGTTFPAAGSIRAYTRSIGIVGTTQPDYSTIAALFTTGVNIGTNSVTNTLTNDASGRFVALEYEFGTAPAVPGYYDHLSFSQKRAGASQLSTFLSGEPFPEHRIALLTDVIISESRASNYQADLEYRSYRFDFPNAITGAITASAVGTHVEPIEGDVLLEDLSTTFVRSLTPAAALAVTNTAGTKTAQQLSDIVRALWADRSITQFAHEPTLSGRHFSLTANIAQIRLNATGIGQSVTAFGPTTVFITINGVTGLNTATGDFIDGFILDSANTASQAVLTGVNFINGLNLTGHNINGVPHSLTDTATTDLTPRQNLAETEGLANCTFSPVRRYEVNYNGTVPVALYIHNPTIDGTGNVTLTNSGTGQVNVYFSDQLGNSSGIPARFVASGNLAFERVPQTQDTRLFIDASGVSDTGSRYALLRQPAVGTPLTVAGANSDIIASGSITPTSSAIAVAGTRTVLPAITEIVASTGTNFRFATAHNLRVGDTFTVQDSVPTAYNRRYEVVTVTSTTVLTANFDSATAGLGNATTIGTAFRSGNATAILTVDGNDVTFNRTDDRFDDIFRATSGNPVANLLLVISHPRKQTQVYGVPVARNTTSTAITTQAFNITRISDPASQGGVISAKVVSADVAATRSVAVENTLTTASATNNLSANSRAVTFEVSGMANSSNVPNSSPVRVLLRPTEEEAQVLLANTRGTQNYPLAIAEAYRDSISGNIGTTQPGGNNTGNVGVAFDVLQFVNQRNVNASPRALFVDTTDDRVQFLPGVFQTSSDSFTAISGDGSLVINSGLHTAGTAPNTFTEEQVLSERRQVTDVTNTSIRDELDARTLTKASVGNLGLGVPAVDTDGSLNTTPTLPTS